jgi:arylformamidase
LHPRGADGDRAAIPSRSPPSTPPCTHADIPSHCGEHAPSIDQRPLDLYLGPCQVIRIEAQKNGRLSPDDVTIPIVASRVLIRTGTYLDPQSFAEDIASPTPELIDFFGDRGVRLVELDRPSVDPF